MRLKADSRIGERYGRLVITAVAPRREGHSYFMCRCDCGRDVTTTLRPMQIGRTKSCGCLKTERIAGLNLSHGEQRGGRASKELNVWRKMRARCLDVRDHAYADYGGRGITVCERWAQFEHFLADMGRAPKNATIDRIDNDGAYAPENCRWTTPLIQANNRRSNTTLTFDGQTKTVAEWGRSLNIPARIISKRLALGWPVDDIFERPIKGS